MASHSLTLQMSAAPVRFGPFTLDRSNAQLSQEGIVVELRPRAFRVLEILAANRGQYVGYERIMREAWEGVAVSRHTVAVTVAELKKALGEHGEWIRCRPKLGYCLGVPHSDDLIRIGSHLCSLYTRESLEKAVACFEESAQLEGADVRAAVGLCRAHLTLGCIGMRPPVEIYPRFLDALERAVIAAGWTPELRGMRAHALHMFERRLEEAESMLARTIQVAPHLPVLHVNLAMLLATSSRLGEAWAALEAGERVDALFPILPAAETCIRLCERDWENAMLCGRRALELHPYLNLSRIFYAQALEYSGRTKAALAEYRVACTISPDLTWMRALEIAALANAGHNSKAERMLEHLCTLRKNDYVDAYYMAIPYVALGRLDEAMAELERAYEENSTTLPILDVDLRIDALRRHPRFEAWRDKVFRGPCPAMNEVVARYSHIDHVEQGAAHHLPYTARSAKPQLIAGTR